MGAHPYFRKPPYECFAFFPKKTTSLDRSTSNITEPNPSDIQDTWWLTHWNADKPLVDLQAFFCLSIHRVWDTEFPQDLLDWNKYFSLHVCLIFMGKCRYTLLYYISYIDPKVFLSQHFKLEWFVQRFHGIFCRTWMHKTLNHYGKRLYNTISFLLCKIRKNKNKQYSLLYNYRNLAAYRSFTNLCAVRLRENTRFSLPNSQCGRTTCPLPLQSSFSSATGHLYGLLMHGSFNQKTSVEEIERTYAMRCSSRLVLNSSTEGKLALATAYVAFPKCSLFTKPWLI